MPKAKLEALCGRTEHTTNKTSTRIRNVAFHGHTRHRPGLTPPAVSTWAVRHVPPFMATVVTVLGGELDPQGMPGNDVPKPCTRIDTPYETATLPWFGYGSRR